MIAPWILTVSLANTSDVVSAAAAIAPAPAVSDQKPAQGDQKIDTSTVTTPTPKGIQFQTGEYTWKFGGYIKVDLIHDFDDIGSTDSFDPRTIPTSGEVDPGDTTRIHARQTRFNMDVRGPTSAGAFRGFFEGDFFSDQNGFRIRHAYGTVDRVLGGQTWTTFMDEEAMPETLDFESPTAFPQLRQAQVRYTQPLEDGDYFAVSLEDPDSDVEAPTGVTGTVKEPLPDLNARYFWKNDIGHVQLGLFGGMARFVPDVGSEEDAMLWGVNLSTKIETWGQDNAIAQVTYGDGVGRYRGGIAAAPDANGDLEAVEVLALMGSYQHYWSEKYRSTLCYSWGDGDLPDGAAATDTEKITYLAANFIYQFAERAWAGIEYLHGSRDTNDGEDGDADRLQLSIRFDL
jgi:hypothetical protein